MRTYPTVHQLRCFEAVAQELNFRSAAARLNMSQPPLSRQIRALEDGLGVRLFDRSSHHVALTPAGRRLLEQVRRVLTDLDGLLDAAAREAEANRARLRIGLTRVIDPVAMPEVSRALDGVVAAEGLDEVHGPSRRLIADVQAGRLDLALVAVPADRPADLAVTPVDAEPLVVAVAETHPAARQQRLDLRDLGDLPLFWFRRSANPVLYDRVAAAFAQIGYRPETVAKPTDRAAMLDKVARGAGYALVPASTRANRRPGVAYRRLCPALEAQLQLDLCVLRRRSETNATVLQAERRLVGWFDAAAQAF